MDKDGGFNPSDPIPSPGRWKFVKYNRPKRNTFRLTDEVERPTRPPWSVEVRDRDDVPSHSVRESDVGAEFTRVKSKCRAKSSVTVEYRVCPVSTIISRLFPTHSGFVRKRAKAP